MIRPEYTPPQEVSEYGFGLFGTNTGNTGRTILGHLRQYPGRTVFSVVSQTIAATPPLLSVKWHIAIQRQALEGGHRKRLASEAYRVAGGIV